MNIPLSKLRNIFYFHHRFITLFIFCIGGAIAVGVVYVFLFTSAEVEVTQQTTPDVAIKQEELTRILLWIEKRAVERTAPFVVENSAFAKLVP